MATDEEQGADGPHDGQVRVTTTYLPARKPVQLDFAEDTPLGDVKAAIMGKFGVEEGPTPDGQSQVVFQLFEKDGQLTDLTRTIGNVATPGLHAKLNLVKQIIQGTA